MKTSVPALLFALAIVVSAAILGNAYVKRSQVRGTITVTGLGKEDFSSDLVVWEGRFSQENADLRQAAADLETNRKVIEEYLVKQGIPADSIVFSAVETMERTRATYTGDGRYTGEVFEGYILSQSLTITSRNVSLVEGISRRITELLNQGIRFYSEAPRYYYTGLSDLKIALISKATEDARARAEKISEKSGGEIGKLVSAQMGIFQITGQNSNEEFSWGGTFNTASREKSATITMKLTYRVD